MTRSEIKFARQITRNNFPYKICFNASTRHLELLKDDLVGVLVYSGTSITASQRGCATLGFALLSYLCIEKMIKSNLTLDLLRANKLVTGNSFIGRLWTAHFLVHELNYTFI